MIQPRANPDLFGQDRAWRVLLASLHSHRAPHGWLLAGPRGVGKATLAHRFARALLAPSGRFESVQSCTNDPTFRQCALDAHPDLVVIERAQDAKSGRQRSEIGVEAVRQATRSFHRTAAFGGRRILIVDGAELLNRNAVNALLKPLEEPPAGTVILLVTHEPFRLLPTVRSRCALLRLSRLETPVIEAILAAQVPDLEPSTRSTIARIAGGSAGRAVELANGGLDAYRSTLLALASDGASRKVHEVADLLRRRSEAAGGDLLLHALQLLLARIVGVAAGRPPAPAFADEVGSLQKLASRRPLEYWPMLWEKTAGLLNRADWLNLDRTQVLLLVLSDLAGASVEAAALPPGDPDAVV